MFNTISIARRMKMALVLHLNGIKLVEIILMLILIFMIWNMIHSALVFKIVILKYKCLTHHILQLVMILSQKKKLKREVLISQRLVYHISRSLINHNFQKQLEEILLNYKSIDKIRTSHSQLVFTHSWIWVLKHSRDFVWVVQLLRTLLMFVKKILIFIILTLHTRKIYQRVSI